MKRTLISAVVFVSLSQNVAAESVKPKYDLTGTWQAASGGSSSYFQEGTQVIFINNNITFSHYFVGRYITPTKMAGIQHRVTRSSGCSTELYLTATATTIDTLSISAKALDSNCDLVKGQTFTDTISRTE